MYPFNPNAIDCRLAAGREDDKAHEGGTKPIEEGKGDQDETHRSLRGEGDVYVQEEMQFDPSTNQIDSKMEELYQRRFEEGYDIYDPEYVE